MTTTSGTAPEQHRPLAQRDRVRGRGRLGGAVVATALLLAAVTVPGRAVAAGPVLDRVEGGDRVATAIAISRATHTGAQAAVLARADDFADALAAAPIAVALGGPVLLTATDDLSDGVREELERLEVARVVLMGGPEALSRDLEDDLPPDVEVERVQGADRYGTAAAAADRLEAASGAGDGVVVVAGTTFADAVSAAPLAAMLGWPLLLTEPQRLPPDSRAAIEERAPDTVLVVGGPAAVADDVVDDLEQLAPDVRRLHGPDRYATAIAVHREAVARGAGTSPLWLATGRSFADALTAGPAVAAGGASMLLVDGHDLREPLHVARRLRELGAATDRFVLVGGTAAITGDAGWQLPVVLSGHEVPRGGLTLFPRYRMVAFYGHHSTAAMGVLGEQPPDQAYERLWQQAHPYGPGGRPVLPTFELIVSVATKAAGPDGDYSSPSTPEQIQPWLDAARRHGVYLLLDLQTGRTDFLTEARRYEQFLNQPDVGLALDPEWRMDAHEVPGQSVGEVHASEVNAVADYLSDLVRRHHLPQKLLVIHQFQTRMVEDKHQVVSPPELAVMFHMDGHGSRSQKRTTYAHVSDPTGRWANGFKLFYDEDSDVYRPHELLAEVRPVPDLISYQ